MISDHDRAYYIVASDTEYVLRSWKTKTFEKWWFTKLGLTCMNFSNDAMMAGTAYEHKILDSLEIPGMQKDRQVIIGRLRVNLDGSTNDTIYEVKTYRAGKCFKPSKAYWDQVQVEMYVTGFRKAYIVAYCLQSEDYFNFYRDIDTERLSMHPIDYDKEFINNVYLPKFKYLEECLNDGKFPTEEEYGKQRLFEGSIKGLDNRKFSAYIRG